MVEEAGQVLEAHILASLVDSGQFSHADFFPLALTLKNQSNILSASEIRSN